VRQTASDADPYRQIVKYYDLEHDSFQDDLPLISHLVETVGDPVLELACGTGRILAPLSQPGRRLTGVDSSRAMLDAARDRMAHSPGNIELIQADMADLSLPDDEFGIVIIALNGLLHATTLAAQRKVLAEAFRCLDRRGMLYLDIANPAVSWPSTGHQPVIMEGAWTTAKGDRVQKFQSVSVDPATQIIETNIWYDISDCDDHGDVSRLAAQFDLRYLHAAELELLLELSGFVEWQIYGNYELDPYTAETPRIIAMAEKTASR
jgi:ubiquinone/menaquinone biosynthesis C-methylase UbiE